MPERSIARKKSPDRWEVSLANSQTVHAVDESQLVDAARAVLEDSEFDSASISLAVVDDPTMQELNRQYLQHDWPTDVLSFSLDDRDGHLEGEVILSADTAAAAAAKLGWPAAAEQLLYVIHGMLHLVGYGDTTPEEINAMRAAEVDFLSRFDMSQPIVSDESATISDAISADQPQQGLAAP